jgi:integrase
MKLPNGYGTVYKQKGNRRKPFVARVTVGYVNNEETGKNKQLYQNIGYYETKKEALIALAEYNANPYDIDAAKVTFKEMYDKFVSTSSFDKLSRSSKAAYSAAYNRCEPIWTMKFVDLRKPHLQDCIDDIDDAGWGTKKKLKTLYNQLYTLARECDVCEKNYAEFVDIGERETVLDRTPFTDAEKKLCWLHIKDIEYLDTIIILLYTGMRVSEMLDIKTADVDIEGGFMRGGSKTFAGINRLIPIHSKIMDIVKRYYNPDNEYLVTYPDGGHISYGNYRDSYWDRIMPTLNMTHLPHDTRHTFISNMDTAGANPMAVKRIVGHAGNGITEKVYTHKDIEELKRNIELLA